MPTFVTLSMRQKMWLVGSYFKKNRFFRITLLILFITQISSANKASKLIENGWSELAKDNDSKAVHLFSQALEEAKATHDTLNCALSLLNLGMKLHVKSKAFIEKIIHQLVPKNINLAKSSKVMKKITTLLFAMITSFVSFGQTQIPNGDFESLLQDGTLSNWGNIYLTNVWIDDSTGVFHGDSIIYDGPFCGPSTDSHSGNGALELRNAYNFTAGYGIVGGAGVDIDSVFASWSSLEIVFEQVHPTELNFYFKHIAVNNDTAIARLTLYDQFGYQVGLAECLMIGNVNVYTYSSTPVVYISADSVFAYSLQFFNYHSDLTGHVQCPLGSRTLIDDVTFGFSTGISEVNGGFNFSVYPTPALDQIKINQLNAQESEYQILDIAGRMVQNGLLSADKIIRFENKLAGGIYIVTLKSSTNTFQKKFVVD